MPAHSPDTPPRSRTGMRIATAVFLAGLLALVVIALPKGFDTDLAKIGDGTPALVFVYDPNLVVSNRQTREMDAVRETLGATMHFLIADIGRPEAQRFMQQYQAEPTQLLLFAPDGRLLGRMQGLASAKELLTAIAEAGVSD